MFEEYKDLVDIKELMEMLGVGRDRAYSLINSGEINSFRIGKKFRIPKKCIADYVNSQLL